jgi:hypothetical protein
MLPLYAARIEDLGPGEFVKVDCAACHHVALLPPEALRRGGLSPAAKVLDLKGRLRCRGAGGRGGLWFRSSGGDGAARSGERLKSAEKGGAGLGGHLDTAPRSAGPAGS